jgi:ABC-type maltose transport system permease subunit
MREKSAYKGGHGNTMKMADSVTSIEEGAKLKNKIKHIKVVRTKILRFAAYIFLIDMTYIFLFPFLYMIVTSIKSGRDLYDLTVNWVPKSVEIKNYLLAFNILDYMSFFKNSFIITVGATIGHIISCSFIGYGFARYSFVGKKPLLIILSHCQTSFGICANILFRICVNILSSLPILFYLFFPPYYVSFS